MRERRDRERENRERERARAREREREQRERERGERERERERREREKETNQGLTLVFEKQNSKCAQVWDPHDFRGLVVGVVQGATKGRCCSAGKSANVGGGESHVRVTCALNSTC